MIGLRRHFVRDRVVLDLAFAGPAPIGGKAVSQEVRRLIFGMVAENPTWSAPRIHGELLIMLGFDISERSVSGWMKPATRTPILRNDG